MYDPRRLRGPLVALAMLVAALIVGGLALKPVVAGRPRWLPDADSLCDVASFKENLGRIAGVVRRGGPARLGLLVGSSSLDWGVDAARMPRMDESRPMRWLSIAAMGSTIEDNARMASMVFRAGLKPEVVVLALGPASLASRINILDDPTSPDLAVLREHVSRRHPVLVKEDLEGYLLLPWNRVFPNRSRIGRWARVMLFDARLDLFAALGHGPEDLGPPLRDPWSALPWWTEGIHESPEVLDKQFKGLADAGVFEAGSYSADSQNARNLVRLVRDLRAAGSEVVVALFPEAERRRVAEPPEFLGSTEEALRRAFGDAAPPVLDFRAAMPADAFFDLSHLNPIGRAAFTEKLGRALQDLRAKPAK